ncbi:MAG TPA: hypothetical protein VHI95_07055 [Acidimicrobiales bacterium]|jgi:hypothetical protein|nr:hypothetical protein [Acidimicrobiales bacterium]
MTNPQQPELAQKRRSAVVKDSAKAHVGAPPVRGEAGPIPEDNVPGHHPEVESDKPTHPPHLPHVDHRFAFRFDSPVGAIARRLGVNERSAYVHVLGDTLSIRFGPWSMQTSTSNVESATVTGPYQWWKVVGPPRLSIIDHGITFATTTVNGVCIKFREPVAGGLPVTWLRHPAATVTVDDVEDLVTLLDRH